MNFDLATISVISSACVAIASILLPILTNLLNDNLRWSRERKVAKAEKIDTETTRLLEHLSHFVRSADTGNIQMSAQRHFLQLRSDLLSSYYSWERTIWVHCKKAHQDRLKKLREEFEKANQDSLYEKGSHLADEILELSHIATDRLWAEQGV